MKRTNTLHLLGMTAFCIILMAGCAKPPVEVPIETPSQASTEPTPPADPIDQAISESKEEAPEVVLERVHFAFDKYTLSPEARAILSANAVALQSNPGLNIKIEGHCDDHGSDEYNLVLGERRAQAVKSFLVTSGVDAARLETISYGEEMPLDRSNTSMASAKNRRAEFKLLN